ncbi:cytochrome-c peroxidase [Hymenobacter sp. 15J16-1T3B]|uniref:cytochrome-c peroxidase n=1 Tax=Hymenobacter sp. 15J16-1T3B TaxID=2886941 RepID=UPI001D128D9C|nr:cytochrome c peroxidase [Hymenobacter sp. 15J16-1T3B]MCC3158169.1 cytochrome-c peroxidase [Hymenobacter sp. 15J16-1T3B]
MLHTVTLRRLIPLAAASALLVAACKPDKDVEEAFAAPTPLTLATPQGFPAMAAMPADNPLTEQGVALGRMLFYEKKLSSDGTVSCGSCHQQSKAFTDGRARALGVGGQQHARGSMALMNMAWSQDFTWDGAHTELEKQARVPLENPVEMHQSLATSVTKLQQTSNYPKLFGQAFGSSKITEENVLKALAQFERTLVSANSRYDQALRFERSLTSTERQGQQLMGHATAFVRGAECVHCHDPQLLFAGPRHTFFNNGLDQPPFADPGRGGVTGVAFDQGMFKAPSLRNIALTAPYMHDGRFQTLEEVLDHYSDHVKVSANLDPQLINSPNDPSGRITLTALEKQKIIAFLHTLTDSTFITDPRFSDPNP